MKFKEKTRFEKIKIIVISSLIAIMILLGSLAELIFPDSTFANVIKSSIGKFFNLFDFVKNHYVTVLESITIIVFVWILNKILVLIIKLLTVKGQRSDTIGRLLTSIIRYLSVVIALFLILSAWGVQTPTLLAGAGIIGLALSFGAQSLIEDIFAGLFIIFEKQFVVGDVIEINEMRGTVIEIGIRVSKIEDLQGDILIINNSDIRGIINSSASLSLAICDISVGYDQNLDQIEEAIKNNLETVRKHIPQIKEGPFYYGVEKLADSSITLRITAKTDEKDKHKVRRQLNKEMRMLFEKENINIPFPQLVIHQEENNQKDKD